jgi:hypothetical protein
MKISLQLHEEYESKNKIVFTAVEMKFIRRVATYAYAPILFVGRKRDDSRLKALRMEHKKTY